ncbi:hypothetical protein [Legionella cardiaca]|uniref:Uncharacterized protein n=1 Tax=Legionella cardiaca TaxID=1071983 RepID=A0ABY8AMW9_9GAMM|nr:hypothetical protein [Legionella cardiaca]WED41804.1 hypothetical protein PXX05_07615 [Legionella cardiaca]
MRQVNNVIYNQANLNSWNDELPNLKSQIQSSSHFIGETKKVLIPLNSQLQVLNSNISSLRLRINLAEIELSRHQHHHHGHNHHGHSHGIIDGVVDTVATLNLIQMRGELSTLLSQQSGLEREIQDHINQIQRAEDVIEKCRKRIEWIDKHIQKGQQFLQTLNNNPSQLTTHLQQKLVANFKNYDFYHPAGVSPQVRFCLLNLQEKFNELFTLPVPATLYPLTQVSYPYIQTYLTQTTSHINYLRFCGFLWEMHHRVANEGIDEDFNNILVDLLNETHIPENGDLPDHMATGKTANIYYQEIKPTSSYLQDLTNEQLIDYESKIFEAQLSWLKPYLKRENPLQVHIANAVALIETEIKEKQQKNEPVDYHFYIHAVRDFNKITREVPDSEVITHLNLLAEHASGSPSLGKKIGGVLLTIGGLALIVASIAGLCATFGGSIAGITLGLTILQASALTLTAIGGSALTFFGVKTVQNGMQRGLSKELQHIHGDCQSLYSPSQPNYG